MKLVVFHNLPSGGGKRALYEMVRRLAERHVVDVFSLSCAEHRFCDIRPHVRQYVIHPFKPSPLCHSPFGRLNQGIRAYDLLRLDRLYRRLATQIDAGGYDVAFVHNCQFMASPSLLAYLRTPAVYYCEEPPRQIYEPDVARPFTALTTLQRAGNLLDPLPKLYRKTLRWLDRRGAQSARLVLVNSHYSRESLYRVYGLFAQVGYLGVDVKKFVPLGLARERFALSVGALTPRKGFDFLIRSLSLISPQRRPSLVLVSNFQDDREREYLTQLARRSGVELSMRVLVSDDELVQLYNTASVTLYAPIMEPFGFVPIESMACGTPVVGVREAGVRESVLDGETGILTERDEKCFAQAITYLLDDPDAFARLSKRCREFAEERWSWERAVKRIETYLESVAR